MSQEKINLADIVEKMEKFSFTQEDLKQIRSLIEKLREYDIGRKEYQLPSPSERRRIRTGITKEPDPRTIKLTTAHR